MNSIFKIFGKKEVVEVHSIVLNVSNDDYNIISDILFSNLDAKLINICPEIDTWLKENISYKVNVKYIVDIIMEPYTHNYEERCSGYFRFDFKTIDDAVLFKMTWNKIEIKNNDFVFTCSLSPLGYI